MGYYARDDFFNNPEVLKRTIEILKGNLKLDWMRIDVEKIHCRPSDPRRGLTFADTNVGSYGWDQIREKIRHNYSMAPRGAHLPPGLPHLGYDINRKSEVWSENAPALYEESKARHWLPSRDVPWEAVEKLDHSEEFERGLAQLYTDLTCMATLLGDIPSKWVWRINRELVELKMWQCTQMFGAAQLADVFRKRGDRGWHRPGPRLRTARGVAEERIRCEQLSVRFGLGQSSPLWSDASIATPPGCCFRQCGRSNDCAIRRTGCFAITRLRGRAHAIPARTAAS